MNHERQCYDRGELVTMPLKKKKYRKVKPILITKEHINNFIRNMFDIDNEMIEPSSLTIEQRLNLKRLKNES